MFWGTCAEWARYLVDTAVGNVGAISVAKPPNTASNFGQKQFFEVSGVFFFDRYAKMLIK